MENIPGITMPDWIRGTKATRDKFLEIMNSIPTTLATIKKSDGTAVFNREHKRDSNIPKDGATYPAHTVKWLLETASNFSYYSDNEASRRSALTELEKLAQNPIGQDIIQETITEAQSHRNENYSTKGIFTELGTDYRTVLPNIKTLESILTSMETSLTSAMETKEKRVFADAEVKSMLNIYSLSNLPNKLLKMATNFGYDGSEYKRKATLQALKELAKTPFGQSAIKTAITELNQSRDYQITEFGHDPDTVFKRIENLEEVLKLSKEITDVNGFKYHALKDINKSVYSIEYFALPLLKYCTFTNIYSRQLKIIKTVLEKLATQNEAAINAALAYYDGKTGFEAEHNRQDMALLGKTWQTALDYINKRIKRAEIYEESWKDSEQKLKETLDAEDFDDFAPEKYGNNPGTDLLDRYGSRLLQLTTKITKAIKDEKEIDASRGEKKAQDRLTYLDKLRVLQAVISGLQKSPEGSAVLKTTSNEYWGRAQDVEGLPKLIAELEQKLQTLKSESFTKDKAQVNQALHPPLVANTYENAADELVVRAQNMTSTQLEDIKASLAKLNPPDILKAEKARIALASQKILELSTTKKQAEELAQQQAEQRPRAEVKAAEEKRITEAAAAVEAARVAAETKAREEAERAARVAEAQQLPNAKTAAFTKLQPLKDIAVLGASMRAINTAESWDVLARAVLGIAKNPQITKLEQKKPIKEALVQLKTIPAFTTAANAILGEKDFKNALGNNLEEMLNKYLPAPPPPPR